MGAVANSIWGAKSRLKGNNAVVAADPCKQFSDGCDGVKRTLNRITCVSRSFIGTSGPMHSALSRVIGGGSVG